MTKLPGLALLALIVSAVAGANPLVIAHRGASAYVTEHTLAAAAMAYAMGADYLEIDVVVTRDGVPIVFHDLYLDAMTNVADAFPERAREDGYHYVADFDFSEVEQLALHERVSTRTGKSPYPRRFPPEAAVFGIPSLESYLRLVRGLNHSGDRTMGVYVELKWPAWHAQQGLDVTAVTLDVLHRSDYRGADDRAYIQCFDATALKHIARRGLTDLPLIQLIGEDSWWPDQNFDFERMRTPQGLREVARYAAGIGPWFGQIVVSHSEAGEPQFSSLVADAHGHDLLVHTYTLRADRLPSGVADFEQLLRELTAEQKVDGVITDHPDRVREFLAPGGG